jgi:hypothetical protein
MQALADHLTEAHIVALAVYSQATYKLINITLRTTMDPTHPDPGPELWTRLSHLTDDYLEGLAHGNPWPGETPNAVIGLLHTGPPAGLDLRLTPLGAAWVDASRRLAAATHARDADAIVAAQRDVDAARQQIEDQLRADFPRLETELRWHADMVYDALMALPVVGSAAHPVIAFRGDEIGGALKQILYGTDSHPRGEARQVLSVTRDVGTAIDFVARDAASGNEVGIVVYELTGVGGRDIAPFSMFAHEAEIVLPPGSMTDQVANPDRAVLSLVENHPDFSPGTRIIVVREVRPHGP